MKYLYIGLALVASLFFSYKTKGMGVAQIIAVIGLGNPGPKFTHTRHNIGFRILDKLAEEYNVLFKTKNNMEIAEIQVDNKNIILVKPITFMNKVGEIYPHLRKKNIGPENILAVHDELEKPLCELKFRKQGSHRGHNGLRSLIDAMNTNDFFRLGFGIGRPLSREPQDVGDFVLGRFSPPEEQKLENCINNAAAKILEIIEKEHPGGKLD